MATLAEVTGPAPATGGGLDWGALVSSAIPAALAARRQDKVMKLNLEREQKGLPLLNVENYQPGVRVGLDKGTRNMILTGVVVTVLVLGGVAYAARR